MRALDRPGRSVVYAGEAMAATSHPLATATALDMLRRGGTAMDASIAAAAVLAVVEPAETGIGGDCFALYAPAGRVPPFAFNGSGRAPSAAHLEWYRERGLTVIPDDSAHAVTYPGAVDAWCRLHEAFGRLPLAEVLEPAIGYARSGYPVHESVGHEWRCSAARLDKDETARALFLPSGRAPDVGSVISNPPLARTLSLIAERGRQGFYEDEVAAAIVDYLRSRGGLHTLEDFSTTAGEFVEPILADYEGRCVFQLPPNSQGVVALLMLKLLELHKVGGLAFLSPERIHLAIEVGKLAYEQRDKLLGDADRSGDLLELVRDSERLAELAACIVPQQARPAAPTVLGRSNTVYLTVVDSSRNVASFINSIFHSFGSGLCPPGTGVLLQNRGCSFRLDPHHPNALGPRRRPMHTIIPGLVGHDGRAELGFGVMGGDYQPMGHAHILSALYAHELDLQSACDAPRYVPAGDHVIVEGSLPDTVCEALERWGHKLQTAPRPLGGAQVIRIDWGRGLLSAGSDPRKDGCALGF